MASAAGLLPWRGAGEQAFSFPPSFPILPLHLPVTR
jgi:hypothetical protein